jgi:hypothetical protein
MSCDKLHLKKIEIVSASAHGLGHGCTGLRSEDLKMTFTLPATCLGSGMNGELVLYPPVQYTHQHTGVKLAVLSPRKGER